jgi:hypothetical protein
MAAIGAHVVRATLTNLVLSGQNAAARDQAFGIGDELFAAPFNAADGSGANVGVGSRFTRMPRADLRGTGQWASKPAKAKLETHDVNGSTPTWAGPSRPT